MKIGFLNNQIDNRGTGNALFDYAHYNETILGNKSFIMALDQQPRNPIMEKRLESRFGKIYATPEKFPVVDVLYHIKYGNKDNNWNFDSIRYVVHAVFDASQPHGDRYAAISEWLGNKSNKVPFVPHIVLPNPRVSSLRTSLGIPTDAIVFGRHGGYDTFDINWAWDSINDALYKNENIWFLFLNTKVPDIEITDSKRVIFLNEASSIEYKYSFINTCDAMLHARARGETFGIAVGEFAIAGKPVLTFGDSPERAHIQQLDIAFTYYSEEQLTQYLTNTKWVKGFTAPTGYTDFTPDKVMAKFKEVFLD